MTGCRTLDRTEYIRIASAQAPNRQAKGTQVMGNRNKVADILEPLLELVAQRLEGKDDHDPLIPVQKHLARLTDQLRSDVPILDKITTLQELGYLKEQSVSENVAAFHDAVSSAIEETMTPGWN